MSSTSFIARIFGASMLALACGPQVELGDDGSSTTGTSSTESVETTAGPTTASPTTVGPVMTTDPVETTTTTGVDPDDSGASTGVVLPEDCSTVEQDCPRGYKCMPWANDGGGAWNDTKCVPIAEDPSAPGEPCMVEGNGTSGVDDCDGTSMCWNVDPKTNIGTCQPFCIGTDEEPTCENPCDTCPQFSNGAITLCFETCDPLLQNCDSGEACYPIQQTFACAPDASPKGTGIASACEFVNVCPPGMACVDASVVPGCPDGSGGCCAPYCPVGGADPCPGLLPGTSCVPWFGEDKGPPMECQSAPPGVCVQE
jgi:hypothetical protein